MNRPNRVFPLTITILSPLHIDSGTRMYQDLDYYVDTDTVYVIDSDAVLDLVAQRWEAEQVAPDVQRQQAEAALATDEARWQQRRERNMREIEAFEQSPPKDRRKAIQQEERLVREANQIKAAMAQLKQRRLELERTEFADSSALPEALVNNSGVTDLLKTNWLTREDLRNGTQINGRPLVRYRMSITGKPNSSEVYAQIKDIADRLYLPGSSLKGALRSALAWRYAAELRPEKLREIGSGAKFADNKIEEAIFYGRANRSMNSTLCDVMRTLHIGDTQAVAGAPELHTVKILRSHSQAHARIAIETVPVGMTLQATMQIERYPFESSIAQREIHFDKWKERLSPEAIAEACRQRAADLISGERAYFTHEGEVVRFYADLQNQLTHLGPGSFMLPVGWGAGWRSKSLDSRLQQDAPTFAETVKRFKLKKHKSATFKPGGSFPDTRKIALRDEQPWQPLGWLLVEIGAEVQR